MGRVGLSEVGLILSIDVTRPRTLIVQTGIHSWTSAACAAVSSPIATASMIRAVPTVGYCWA